MKAKPKDIERAIHRPDPALRVYLFFGPDAGLVRERAAALCANLVPDVDDPFAVTRLSDEDLKADPAALSDALAALSLTRADRLVRLRLGSDMASLGALVTDVEAGSQPCEAKLVIEAGDLKPASRLRKAVEDGPTSLAIGCYADAARDLMALAEAELGAEQITLAPDSRALLAPFLEGDRALARSEIQKLILYKGLASQRDGRTVTVEPADIVAISAAGAESALDQVLEPALTGDPARTDLAYHRALDAGTSPVAVLRALQRRLDQIDHYHTLGGDPSALARAGAPRFGPPAEMFKRAARTFTGRRFDQARRFAFEAERAVKQSGAPAEAIVGEVLLRLARAAAASR